MKVNIGDIHGKVLRHMKHACGITSNASLLLCVSGGVDSMALLHLMMQMRSSFRLGFDVSVVHFNHQKRTLREAQQEYDLVRFWSERFYRIPFHYRELSEEGKSAPTSSSFQELARHWRRAECLNIIQEQHQVDHLLRLRCDESSHFSSSTAQGQGRDKTTKPREYCIVTGHHQDDQLEGVLLKMLRGTHISRLTPMLPRENLCIPQTHPRAGSVVAFGGACRTGQLQTHQGPALEGSNAVASVSVLHPLLPLLKSELRAYMSHEHKLAFEGSEEDWRTLVASPHLTTAGVRVGSTEAKRRPVVQFTWSEDPSNAVPGCRRNEVRLELMPLMERLCGGASNAARRLMALSEQSWDLRKNVEADALCYLSTVVPTLFEEPSTANASTAPTHSHNDRVLPPLLLRLPVTPAFFALGRLARCEVVYMTLTEAMRRHGVSSDSLRQKHIHRVLNLCGDTFPRGKVKGGTGNGDRGIVRLAGDMCVRFTCTQVAEASNKRMITDLCVECNIEIYVQKLERRRRASVVL